MRRQGLTSEGGLRPYLAMALTGHVTEAWVVTAGEIVGILDERIVQSSGRRRQTVLP